MSNLSLVSPERLSLQRWRRSPGYSFAADKATVSIVVEELAKAALCLPICFSPSGENWRLLAIQSFEPGKNVLVAPDGRWIGDYIPAAYRSYPFALAKIEGEVDRYALCVDMESGLIGAEHDLPFFEANGELSQPVKEVLDFLQQVERNRTATLGLCAALDAEGLIVPWEITVNGKDGQTKINDLFRIDEAKLNSLDPAALARLHQAGALPVAYCQLISMQHIHKLAKLADAHAKIESQQQENPNGSLAGDFIGSDGKIDFSSFN